MKPKLAVALIAFAAVVGTLLLVLLRIPSAVPYFSSLMGFRGMGAPCAGYPSDEFVGETVSWNPISTKLEIETESG